MSSLGTSSSLVLGHLRCPVCKCAGELGVVTYDVEPFGLEDVVMELEVTGNARDHFELDEAAGLSRVILASRCLHVSWSSLVEFR